MHTFWYIAQKRIISKMAGYLIRAPKPQKWFFFKIIFFVWKLKQSEDIYATCTSVVFGSKNDKPCTEIRDSELDFSKNSPGRMEADCSEIRTQDVSFDCLPSNKEAGPNFAHVKVVRNKAERKQLPTYTCKECERYWK